jgi:YaiO family outer membrane protein
MKIIKPLFLFLSLVCFSVVATAQEWKKAGVDDLFDIARKEIFDGRRSQGQEMLRFILEKSPDYADVQVFLARTYAWDGDYDKSRELLSEVVQKNPSHLEGVDALIDVELWDNNYNEALLQVRAALQIYPNHKTLLYKHAYVLSSIGKHAEALAVLEQLLTIDPTNEKAIILRNAINAENKKITVSVSSGVDHFSRSFRPAYNAYVQAGRVNNWGSSIVRMNYSRRFGEEGLQYEVDLYPAITKGVYAYVNYGFSKNSLFPDHRVGAEVYSSLPGSLEASLGMRYLYFNTDSKVAIYTGSVGAYFNNYWVSFRPFIIPDRHVGTSFSGSASVRRYWKDSQSYLGLSAGIGFSPDLRTMQSNAGVSETEIYILKSQRVGATWQQNLNHLWSINVSIDVARQELSFDNGSYVVVTSTNVTLRRKL